MSEIDAHVEITDSIATFPLTQVYVNLEKFVPEVIYKNKEAPIEVCYLCRKREEEFIAVIKATVDDKTIEDKIMEKDKIKEKNADAN